MKQEVLNIRVLVADEGFALTEADNSIDPEVRTYAGKIYLSAQDDPANYVEVPCPPQESDPDPENIQPSEGE